jgi:hypothetical protein
MKDSKHKKSKVQFSDNESFDRKPKSKLTQSKKAINVKSSKFWNKFYEEEDIDDLDSLYKIEEE